MNAFRAANTAIPRQHRYRSKRCAQDVPMYVPQLMLLNEGPVTMTTMKLNVQFDAVLNAFAGARMRRPTISAGLWGHYKRMSAANAGRGNSHRAKSYPASRRRRTS